MTEIQRRCRFCFQPAAATGPFCSHCGERLDEPGRIESETFEQAPGDSSTDARKLVDPNWRREQPRAQTPQGDDPAGEAEAQDHRHPAHRPAVEPLPGPNAAPIRPTPALERPRETLRLMLRVQGLDRPIAIPHGRRLTVGSDPTCDAVITDDVYVSSHHAVLLLDDGGLVLEDLNSTNGSHLRISGPVRLKVGDEVRLGATVIRIDAQTTHS